MKINRVMNMISIKRILQGKLIKSTLIKFWEKTQIDHNY